MSIIETRVVSIDLLTPQVLKIVLDAKQALNLKAGQYLQVVMGEQDKRPFSIANMPSSDGLIELHIGASQENPHAYEVVQLARKNKALTVEVNLGDAFRRDSELPAIIVAGGTGYSYAKSILFDSLREQPARKIYLYWGAKSINDLYEANILAELAKLHENFEFVPVIEEMEPGYIGKTGLVHEAVLQDFNDLSEVEVYVAGRFEMATVVKKAFLPLGLKEENLIGDAFAFL